MTCSIQTEANNLVYRLVQGQLTDIADQFSYPVIVYVGEKILVMKSTSELINALAHYRAILAHAGLGLVTTNVLDSNRSDDEQCKVSVENRYFSTNGDDLGRARINYFCDTKSTSPKIRMVEYLEWPCAKNIADCEPLQNAMA